MSLVSLKWVEIINKCYPGILVLPCFCFAWSSGMAIYRNKYLALEENISPSLYSLVQFLRNLSLTEYFKENPKRIRFAFPVTWIYISPLIFLTILFIICWMFSLCRAWPMATWGWARLTAWPRPVTTKPATAQLASLLRYREYTEHKVTQSSTESHQVVSDASTNQSCLTGVSFNRIHYMHLQHHLQE